MKSTDAALAAVVSTAAVAVAGCGIPAAADPPMPPPAPAVAPASFETTAAHNAADIAFAQDMIPHHQQAVDMTPPAATRAGDERVRVLAAGIRRAQESEIGRMRTMLVAWCAPETGAMPGAGTVPPGAATVPPVPDGIPGMDHMNDGTDHTTDGTDGVVDGTDHVGNGMPGTPGNPDAGRGGAAGTTGMMTPEQMAELRRTSGPAFDRAFLTMMIAHHEGGVAMARAELADGANPEARALAQQIVDSQEREIAQMRAMLG